MSETAGGRSVVRLLPMPLALVFMLLGLLVGVLRLMLYNGIAVRFPTLEPFYAFHSEMVVFGFLGILIMFERVIGLEVLPKDRRPVTARLMIPLFAAGMLVYLAGSVGRSDPAVALGGVLMALGSFLFAHVVWRLFFRSGDRLSMAFMLLGVAALTVSSIVSTGVAAWERWGFALLLLSFPVMFILGERVELTRFSSGASERRGFRAALIVASVSLVLLVVHTVLLPSTVLLGAASIGFLSVISVTYRVEAVSLRRLSRLRSAINRYVGIHTRLAYYWIIAGMALLLLRFAGAGNPFLYDAFVHSIAVGFVGTMILAHGPVILPVLLRRPLSGEALSLIPLLLLTLGNLIRVVGDLVKPLDFGVAPVIGYSGLLILASLLSFFVMMLRAMKSVAASPVSRR